MASEESGGFHSFPSITTGNAPTATSVSGDPWQTPQKKTKKIRWVLFFFFLLLVGGGIFWFLNAEKTGKQSTEEVPVEKSQSPPAAAVPETVLSEPEPTPLFGDALYRSENFRVGDIAIGGEASFFLSEDNPAPLEITDVRGDAFTEKNKREVRLVLSWRTNKLAKADVEYSKGVGQTPKISSEDDFGLNHSLVITGLDQASTYVYTIKSRDRFGNEQASDPHAVYTGSKTVSLFDLIADAVGDVFGWAVKKK